MILEPTGMPSHSSVGTGMVPHPEPGPALSIHTDFFLRLEIAFTWSPYIVSFKRFIPHLHCLVWFQRHRWSTFATAGTELCLEAKEWEQFNEKSWLALWQWGPRGLTKLIPRLMPFTELQISSSWNPHLPVSDVLLYMNASISPKLEPSHPMIQQWHSLKVQLACPRVQKPSLTKYCCH